MPFQAAPPKYNCKGTCNKRVSVFLGSSVEGLPIAKAIQRNLDHVCEIAIWCQGVFGSSEMALESLEQAMDCNDFAILVLTPDDMYGSRGKALFAPRDNILFELGMFMGRFGRKRTFAVYDRTAPLKLPTDLAGVNAVTFQLHSSKNLIASLGAACAQIEQDIATLGKRISCRKKRRKL